MADAPNVEVEYTVPIRTVETIDQLAQKTGKTRDEIVRDAVATYERLVKSDDKK